MSKKKKTFVKYLTNKANITELEQLEQWLTIESNNKLFESYVKTNYFIELSTNSFDKEKAKRDYLNKIRTEKRVIKRKRLLSKWSYSAAAVFVGILLVSYFFYPTIFGSTNEVENPIIVNNQIVPGSNKATLTLEDGSEVVLEKGAYYNSKNAKSNGENLVYENKTGSNTQVLYNYLTIPRGGEFLLHLADGTKIWLNSESKLKFPINFIQGKSREVELLYGEIYLEVSPSTKNNDSDFIVSNKAQQIKVLGTKFNVKAYKDESKIYTTLVEGKVAIKSSKTATTLSPNQQSITDINDGNIAINSIKTSPEIAWINGEFVLQHKSLYEIMKVLSRWYDMEVIFTNKDLEKTRFVGVLGKDQDIISVLNAIKSFGVIKNYEINNKTITLK